MRVQIISKERNTSQQTPNLDTLIIGKNFWDLRNLSRSVAKLTVTRRFFEELIERKVVTSWIEKTAWDLTVYRKF